MMAGELCILDRLLIVNATTVAFSLAVRQDRLPAGSTRVRACKNMPALSSTCESTEKPIGGHCGVLAAIEQGGCHDGAEIWQAQRQDLRLDSGTR